MKEELLKLGVGKHYGEWWGSKIQRKYGIGERRFSLFNTARWNDKNCPSCCSVVPVLYSGPFDVVKLNSIIEELKANGSTAAPGFMKPEGVVVFLKENNGFLQITSNKDESPKGGMV